jgi:hypothetical protein
VCGPVQRHAGSLHGLSKCETGNDMESSARRPVIAMRAEHELTMGEPPGPGDGSKRTLVVLATEFDHTARINDSDRRDGPAPHRRDWFSFGFPEG